MQKDVAVRQMSRGEKETEAEAALSAVAIQSAAEVDSLDAIADRIERAARDLSAALRELAQQRRIAQNAAE